MVHNRRYRAVADSPLCVAVQRVDDKTPMRGCELLDISVTGVRLASTSTFRFGERFLLHLESEDLGLSTKVESCVQWIRSGRSESEWTLGCAFESELEAEVLEDLVDRGILERRVSDRQQVSIPVLAQWQGRSDEDDAVLHDISSGGFCMTSPHDVEIGSKVCIELNPDEGGESLEGSVTWCSTSENQTIVGCKWKDRKGTNWFRQRSVSADFKSSSRLTRWRKRLASSALPMVLFILGFQLGAYQFQIGRWLELAIHQLQQFVAAF